MGIYHYTDTNSLFSIIKKQRLWATDCRYLNDIDEIVHFKDIFYRVHKKFNSNINSLIEERFEREFKKINNDIFILSFSQSPDKFNLWSYFSDNNGYNIEFDDRILFKHLGFYKYESLVDEPAMTLHVSQRDKIIITKENLSKPNQNIAEIIYGPVIYDDNNKSKIIENFLSGIYADDNNDEDNNYRLDLIIEFLVRNCFFFKKDGFNSEDEYRIIFKLKEKKERDRIIKYRVKGNAVIPFLEINISCKNIIKKINVGPWQNKQELEVMLDQYVKSEILYPIEIGISKLNIR